MTISLLNSFSMLTNADWNAELDSEPWDKKRHILWSDASSFRQRYIIMGFTLGSNMGKALLKPMRDLLVSSATVAVCIFVNFVSECSKWAKRLEDLLAEVKSSVAVITIRGEMDKNEKFGFIQLFTGQLVMADYDL